MTQTAKSTERTQVGGVQEERVKGGESQSDAETESGTQKEVSSECVYTAELDMLALAWRILKEINGL